MSNTIENLARRFQALERLRRAVEIEERIAMRTPNDKPTRKQLAAKVDAALAEAQALANRFEIDTAMEMGAQAARMEQEQA